MAGGLHEVEDSVDSLEGVVQVGSVVEPALVAVGLTDVETVDTTWEVVETDNNVHVVALNGVLGNGAEVLLLVTVVKSGAWNLLWQLLALGITVERSGTYDPSGVGGWNAESVDTDRGELVNGGGVLLTVRRIPEYEMIRREHTKKVAYVSSNAAPHLSPRVWQTVHSSPAAGAFLRKKSGS